MILKAGDNVNRIMTLLQRGQRKLGYGFPRPILHSSRCDDAYLACALGAAIDGPFISVLVLDAVVDANSFVQIQINSSGFAFLEGRRYRKGVNY